MSFQLTGKKAIVTGATHGIGRALVEALLEEGVTVCILDIAPELADVVAEMNASGHVVTGLQADLSNTENIAHYYEEALYHLGGSVDILVNNAGIHKAGAATELSRLDFEKIFKVNTEAVFELSKCAANDMIAQRSGKIINIASVLSFQGGFHASAYSASKGAIALLTKSLSNEWAKDGICVNAIAPGYFDTRLNNHIKNDPKRLASILDRVPKQRLGKPEEIGGLLKFLASDLSDYVTGAIIPIDGGFTGR
ncbi:SDR family NAD(P)-dependent oxidoreductase [Savagea faecisuis]|uniref:SDR family NAD(P)-dependent oxidoreductase n=1 Tax=Savagea faecisuis TaxID=1274803 RepID=A0ABW3GSK7_9BACL